MKKKELQAQYDCIVHNNTDRDGFDSLTAFEEIYSLFTGVRDSQSLQTENTQVSDDGTILFLKSLKDYVNSGTSKNDLKTLINQRIKELERNKLQQPPLPPIESQYHDIALDVIRGKKRSADKKEVRICTESVFLQNWINQNVLNKESYSDFLQFKKEFNQWLRYDKSNELKEQKQLDRDKELIERNFSMELFEALNELCALKTYKDNHGKDDLYQRKKEQAWEKSFTLIEALQNTNEK